MALIYHYCSPQTFLQIIERKCLWLSSTNNMNDSSEGRWYLDLVKDVLRDNELELGDDWCDSAINYLESNLRPSYITCFSTEKDLLSQWRAYADNGSGLAIGFESDDLPTLTFSPSEADGKDVKQLQAQFSIKNVDYCDEKTLKNKIIERARHWCSPHVALEMFDRNDTYENIRASWFSLESEIISTTNKNPAFSEEKEMRIIYRPDYIKYIYPKKSEENNKLKKEALTSVLGGVKHRISDGFLTSYFEYIFPFEAVKEVILGPRNKFTQSDLSDFLLLNGMSHVEIESSAATYR